MMKKNCLLVIAVVLVFLAAVLLALGGLMTLKNRQPATFRVTGHFYAITILCAHYP